MTDYRFLIPQGEAYQGHSTSVLLPSGKVAYTDGLTLAEFERERGQKFRVLSSAEIDQLDREYLQSRVTKPVPISKERFWDMLEVLPPCRWRTVGGVEFFHVAERITHNLVSWFGQRAGHYAAFDDFDDLTDVQVADKFRSHFISTET